MFQAFGEAFFVLQRHLMDIIKLYARVLYERNGILNLGAYIRSTFLNSAPFHIDISIHPITDSDLRLPMVVIFRVSFKVF